MNTQQAPKFWVYAKRKHSTDSIASLYVKIVFGYDTHEKSMGVKCPYENWQKGSMIIKDLQHETEGSTIVKLAGLSSLWAEAQVYASELSGIDLTGLALVQIPDLPGRSWTGKITFTNPEIAADSRLDLIRVTVPNENGLLRPGMPAYVTIKNKDVKALTLPTDAVLRNGKMNIIWLQTGENIFKMKTVETGLESGDRIEIKSGLQNGDVVVIKSAYLLQSEYVFKKGGEPMSGMDMGGSK